jgi:outer membrane protein assembly factor BamB
LGSIGGTTNTAAQVEVLDAANAPVTTATVTVNGTALAYVARLEAYSGSLTVQPGETVSIAVTVEGVTYTGTKRQVEAFPNIYAYPIVNAPTAKTVWSTRMENLIAWSGVIPGPNSAYAVGVLDETGVQVWPSGGVLQSVPVSQTSVTIPEWALTSGNRHIMVGIIEGALFSTAAPGSTIVLSAFSTKPLSVVTFQSNPSPTPPLSQAVGIHIDYAHTGRATVANGSPVFPASAAWETTLDNNVSYPVIADGKVFVLTDGSLAAGVGTGRSLYALDETNGHVLWGPVQLRFESFTYSAHAFDHGRIFVIDYNGRLSAHDAATGAEQWSLTLQEQSGGFYSAPTAVNGIVYVGGPDTLYAVDQKTGAMLWRAAAPRGGTVSSPTVMPGGVFATAPCQAYMFEPLSGSLLWHFSGASSGGGRGTPSVYINNQIYALDSCRGPDDPFPGRTFNAATGTQTGSFDAAALPAFSEQDGFFLANGTLTARNQFSGNTLWSFTGDGELTTSPIVVDDFVVIASRLGKVYALKASDGSVAWSATTSSPIHYSEGDGTPTVLGGNAVGDGYLIVPAGKTLKAWRLVP